MERLVITDVCLFDSVAGKLVANQTVLVENGIITYSGSSGGYDTTQEDNIIEGKGKYLLPGLIDCHVHLSTTAEFNRSSEYASSNPVSWAYTSLLNSQKHLRAGFTTLRDCGSDWDEGPALKKLLSGNQIAGPNLLVANRRIMQWGNVSKAYQPDIFRSRDMQVEQLSGEDALRHAVRQRKYDGSDFIKTATTGGITHGIDSKIDYTLFMQVEIDAMVSEAHRLGMDVACHAHGDQGIQNAINAGVDTLEHGSFMSEESARMMVANGIYLVPTHIGPRGMIDPANARKLHTKMIDKAREVVNAAIANHKIAFQKGVQFALGTDAGDPGNPHGTSAKEISLMVEDVGMNETEALQTATINAARAIKMDDMVGSLEVGKWGDMILITKDPTQDISVLESSLNISHVISKGILSVENGKLLDIC